MILRARTVLPVTLPPIEDGAVAVSEERILAVGRWKDLRRQFSGASADLGEMLLLPGLVNAHCHLDYTDMAGQLAPPKLFPDWIKGLLALKAHWSFSDYAQSWLRGAKMLLGHGVTTVADVEAVPELLPEVWAATPLRVHSYLEMTGVIGRRSTRQILEAAIDKIESLPAVQGSPGLSPHAPYSATPELLRLSAKAARKKGWRLTTHVAESEPEFEMFQSRRGPLFEWLKNQRDMTDCGHGSPVQHLEKHGLLGKNLLAVHVNYLGPNDAALLGQRQVSVAHCPRSHGYFQHQPFPRRELMAGGVNICLGTDSLASVRKERGEPLELNLFAEMRALAGANPGSPPASILQMATINGALALGLEGKIGELSPGAHADLIGLPFSGRLSQAWEAVLRHAGPVPLVMIGGRWVLAQMP
ncbi:MAG: amidohydrolase family protein [Chloroflexi bacterium]|nr:amidohydrolase family protein [Chloroflexota bacterium]